MPTPQARKIVWCRPREGERKEFGGGLERKGDSTITSTLNFFLIIKRILSENLLIFPKESSREI